MGVPMFERQADMRCEQVRRVVALGESVTWGYSASEKRQCWVNLVVAMLEEYQGSKIALINQGVGSNVLTAECPAYEFSAKPSALERVDKELIAHKPDLVFLSYGLNDARGGTAPEVFRRAYQELIDRIRGVLDPVIVVLNSYYMHESLYKQCEHWQESSYEVSEVYNLVIEQLARANGLILADVYSAQVGVDWLVDEDHCHPNDLGHRVIANRVFEAIVRSCSFVARTMPKTSLIEGFVEKYGNGPDKPSTEGVSRDIVADKTIGEHT